MSVNIKNGIIDIFFFQLACSSSPCIRSHIELSWICWTIFHMPHQWFDEQQWRRAKRLYGNGNLVKIFKFSILRMWFENLPKIPHFRNVPQHRIIIVYPMEKDLFYNSILSSHDFSFVLFVLMIRGSSSCLRNQIRNVHETKQRQAQNDEVKKWRRWNKNAYNFLYVFVLYMCLFVPISTGNIQ